MEKKEGNEEKKEMEKNESVAHSSQRSISTTIEGPQ